MGPFVYQTHIVVQNTNVKLAKVRTHCKDPNKTQLKNTEDVEMRAFFGLLIYTAIFKSNSEDIGSMFTADGTGREIFRTVMGGKRFSVLLNCLRFDNKMTRKERLKDSPLAHIEEIFNFFFENCQRVFTIGTCACIDEILVGCRGR
jgi:hypothetical protein